MQNGSVRAATGNGTLPGDSEFRKLWLGQTISEIGSRISREGLPLTAALLLGATPAQMGILNALTGGAALVFSLFAGIVVDRLRRRPILIWSDIGRALLLGTIPWAAVGHWLSYSLVVAVAGAVGVLTVLFDIAYQSYLPSLIDKEELGRGNRLLGMSSATAEVLGPALTGGLIQAITAPRAVLLDALSFLVSAASVAAIRRPENPREPSDRPHWREEAAAGARAIARHPILRALALRSMTAYFFGGVFFGLYVLYAVRVLHMSVVALGFTIALGGAGSLVGAWMAERVSLSLGSGRAFFASALVIGAANLLIPMASLDPSDGVLYLGASQLVGDAAWSLYLVNEVTLRQRVTPEQILGRVNAAMQIASRGVLPLGALAGGFLASAAGMPDAMWVAATGVLLSSGWLWPLRKQ